MDYRRPCQELSILPQPQRPRSFGQRLLAALLPCSCLLCAADSDEQLLCTACQADLPLLPTACCPQCSLPTTHGERCGACLHTPPHFDRCLALFAYDFPADRLVHALKYGHQLPVAKWFGEQMALRLANEPFDLIVPLPLHAERLRQRGFNQSGEIARRLADLLTRPLDPASVWRSRATPPQAELPLKERSANVRNAFESRRDFSGQHVLLVDDVMTSGATLGECARVLKLHGATQVTVAVAARALRHQA